MPEMVLVRPLFQREVMSTPGAIMSTQGPRSEKEARLSRLSEAATVSASGTRAGERLHALRPEFPGSTNKTGSDGEYKAEICSALDGAVERDTSWTSERQVCN